MKSFSSHSALPLFIILIFFPRLLAFSLVHWQSKQVVIKRYDMRNIINYTNINIIHPNNNDDGKQRQRVKLSSLFSLANQYFDMYQFVSLKHDFIKY